MHRQDGDRCRRAIFFGGIHQQVFCGSPKRFGDQIKILHGEIAIPVLRAPYRAEPDAGDMRDLFQRFPAWIRLHQGRQIASNDLGYIHFWIVTKNESRMRLLRLAIDGDRLLRMFTSPPIYEFVMANLRAKAIPQRTVAACSGVPYSTLTKIAQGSIKEPSVHTIQRLADFFAKQLPASQPDHVEQQQSAA